VKHVQGEGMACMAKTWHKVRLTKLLGIRHTWERLSSMAMPANHTARDRMGIGRCRDPQNVLINRMELADGDRIAGFGP
jgi:hypothetical protein